jgi:hypothetical protein
MSPQSLLCWEHTYEKSLRDHACKVKPMCDPSFLGILCLRHGSQTRFPKSKKETHQHAGIMSMRWSTDMNCMCAPSFTVLGLWLETVQDQAERTFLKITQLALPGTVHKFPQILLERLAESEYCWSVYANEQSDTLLDRPLSDKACPHATFSQPTQLRSAHILCLATDVIRIIPYLGSVVKLSIVRGRTSINWPSC